MKKWPLPISSITSRSHFFSSPVVAETDDQADLFCDDHDRRMGELKKMTPTMRKFLFETLYKNRYLYRFASTVAFAGQWRVWQRLVLPHLQGHDVLELGCGLGDLLTDMLAAGYNCRAVEHSSAMVAAARETLRKRKIGKSEDIIQGSAQNLPFPDETFDTVVSTFPSDYISDRNTIAEIKRVLRPGGRVIIN